MSFFSVKETLTVFFQRTDALIWQVSLEAWFPAVLLAQNA